MLNVNLYCDVGDFFLQYPEIYHSSGIILDEIILRTIYGIYRTVTAASLLSGRTVE